MSNLTAILNCIRTGFPTKALELIRLRNLDDIMFDKLLCVVFFESLDAGRYGTAWGIHLYCMVCKHLRNELHDITPYPASIQHPRSILYAATDRNLRLINDILGEHFTTAEALDALRTGKALQSPDRERAIKLACDIRQSTLRDLTDRMDTAQKILQLLVSERGLDHGLHEEYAKLYQQHRQASVAPAPTTVDANRIQPPG